eukprot:TRINITY_DN12680_c0_g1_i1.p1 TRINITY_DN12680_c0_g1~~TRINITY_DN12680_c0_g1_i1.p1  ORF type:complete len:751 (+),score=139.92 TRINITY_DN12680_c0_g1_i1:70-2253(+)
MANATNADTVASQVSASTGSPSKSVRTVFVSAIECTEDEPDDDYQSSIPLNPVAVSRIGTESSVASPASFSVGVDPNSEAVTSNSAEQKGDVTSDIQAPLEGSQRDDDELDILKPPPPLQGSWHQLEGVPRPKGSGARFFAWNDSGHVAFFPEQNRVEAHFADEDKPQRFADHGGLEMASIHGTACCVVASAGADGGSQLMIRPAERWDKIVFNVSLGGDADEACEAIACGDGFVAALTNRRVLRVFGMSGIPLSIVSVPGPGVALAARGSLLLAVIGTGPSRIDDDGEEALEYRLLDVRAGQQRASGRLPLSRGARLRWVGISAEFAPVTVDSSGVVRALLGSGPGSWGSASGLGGAAEWVPVLDLFEQEERGGPLWTVHVARGVLFCTEVGFEEPMPRPIEQGAGLEGLNVSANSEEPVCGYRGHGTALKELPWRLPIGPLSVATVAAEEALREQLLARHLDDATAAGLRVPPEWSSTVGGPSKTWRSKALFLFGQLVKAGEVERALDVARGFLDGFGGAKSLTMAQTFAERAGQRKLADEVAVLQRGAGQAPPRVPQPSASAGISVAMRATSRRPLFEPGEVEEFATTTASASTASIDIAPGQDAAIQETKASVAAVTGAGDGGARDSRVATAADPPPSATAGHTAVPSAQSTPTVPLPVASATEAAEVASAPAPPVAANPFARKRPQQANMSAQQSPHLLRDALGFRGGSSVTEPPKKIGRLS